GGDRSFPAGVGGTVGALHDTGIRGHARRTMAAHPHQRARIRYGFLRRDVPVGRRPGRPRALSRCNEPLDFFKIVESTTAIVGSRRTGAMATPKLTSLELRIMEAVWKLGPCSVREIQEAFPPSRRPAYTTIQTTVYRLETKKAVRRVKKISNAH